MKTIFLLLPATLLSAALASCASIKSTQPNVGAILFEENCQRCHRYAEDLREPKEFLKRTVHYGGMDMPSFQSVLTLEEEDALATYLSTL
ncbi:c-type cytochrome [Solemya elarraichensis gill symbiont]|nr:cytochrome c [Solemya elarraichensis gill symbiont]